MHRYTWTLHSNLLFRKNLNAAKPPELSYQKAIIIIYEASHHIYINNGAVSLEHKERFDIITDEECGTFWLRYNKAPGGSVVNVCMVTT